MAKRCPQRNNKPVIYLDCQECEDRVRCIKESREAYEKAHIEESPKKKQ